MSSSAGHRDQRVLITGAGGFIGTALARAIAAQSPAELLLLDSSERNLFELQQRMEDEEIPHEAVLGSVCDASLLDEMFRRSRPDTVFHAAAFKHVPLLEAHPFAAVRNNALGTHTLAGAAHRYGVPSLLLVSTDKAVNPRSMLGVSKRLAELIVVSLSGPNCRMSAIRLGNVTGSTGSVVPLFLRQIEDGGPVTVTDPQVKRWFLSPDDATQAILAAASAHCDGKILLPELHQPVLIAELAKSLIGGRPVPIQFTRLRPGDKLAEELIYADESRDGRAGPLEIIETRKLASIELCALIEALSAAVQTRDLPALHRAILQVIPEYLPSR